MKKLCGACNDEVMRWYDTRPSHFRGIVIQSIGQDSVRNVIDGTRSRNEQHYERVRRQVALIQEQCNHVEGAA